MTSYGQTLLAKDKDLIGPESFTGIYLKILQLLGSESEGEIFVHISKLDVDWIGAILCIGRVGCKYNYCLLEQLLVL